MFKFTFLVLQLLIMSQCFSQKIDDVLVTIKNKSVSIYQIEKKREHHVHFFNDDDIWRIRKAEFHDGLFTIWFFNYREFLNFGYEGGVVNEINLILDTNNFNLIKLNKARVVKRDYNLDLYGVNDSNIVLLEKIEDTLIYNRYFQKLDYYTNSGNLYKKYTSSIDELILEKIKLQKVECGYYELDLSDSLLAVTYRCGKYRNKKNISEPKIIFYALKPKDIINLSIEGCCPKFSASGRYILYYHASKYYCYDLISERKTELPDFDQAVWVF